VADIRFSILYEKPAAGLQVVKPMDRSVGQERVMTVLDIGLNLVVCQIILETVERQILDAEKREFQLFMRNIDEFLLGQVAIRCCAISLRIFSTGKVTYYFAVV
jgi:hypothetical protein